MLCDSSSRFWSFPNYLVTDLTGLDLWSLSPPWDETADISTQFLLLVFIINGGFSGVALCQQSLWSVEAVIKHLPPVKRSPHSRGAVCVLGNAFSSQAFVIVSQLSLLVWLMALCLHRGMQTARATSLSCARVRP